MYGSTFIMSKLGYTDGLGFADRIGSTILVAPLLVPLSPLIGYGVYNWYQDKDVTKVALGPLSLTVRF
jgi:cephalosporin-C deacetylase-like acetyl esterase